MKEVKVNPSQLQDFDILFCVGDGLLSKAITTIANSEFSHAGHFRLINGKPYVVDAQREGLTAKPWDEWVERFNYKFIVMRETTMTEEKRKQYEEIEFDLLGTRYDFESLVIRHPRKRFIDLLNRICKKKRDNWNEKSKDKERKRLYCTEHVALVRGFENAQPTPKDLLFETIEKGYSRVVF
jgi:hypothetical protein